LWENSRPIAAPICATSLAWPSRSRRAINDACKVAGTAVRRKCRPFAGDRPWIASFRQGDCSGKACRRMRPTCSSMRSSRTRPMARCCASLDGRYTPVSLTCSKANSPRSRRASRSCLREKAAAMWGRAGQRSLEHSALVEAAEQIARALEQMATYTSYTRSAP
jgi:hypothetical protein